MNNDYDEYDYHGGDSLTDAGFFGVALVACIMFAAMVWWMIA